MQQSSQGADYDPNNPYMNLPNQEWRKMQVAYLQVKYKQNAILQGTYDGNDAQQKLDAINYYEQKYGD